MTDESINEADPALDLTPRDVEEVATKRRGWVPRLILVGVIGALGFVMFQTLGSASLFFYNADEAVDRRSELVDQRFRIQGTPFGEAISVDLESDALADVGVVFSIQFEGTVVDVIHVGAPARLFQAGVPVVLEGTWVQGLPEGVDSIDGGAGDGWHFASTDMIVKHDNEYRDSNEERIDEAERGGYNADS